MFADTDGGAPGRIQPKKKKLQKLLKVAEKKQQELAALEGTSEGRVRRQFRTPKISILISWARL